MGLETGAQVSSALRRLLQLLQTIILSCCTGLTSEMPFLQTVFDDFLHENNGSPGIVCHIRMDNANLLQNQVPQAIYPLYKLT